jgi:hypothetical protein
MSSSNQRKVKGFTPILECVQEPQAEIVNRQVSRVPPDRQTVRRQHEQVLASEVDSGSDDVVSNSRWLSREPSHVDHTGPQLAPFAEENVGDIISLPAIWTAPKHVLPGIDVAERGVQKTVPNPSPAKADSFQRWATFNQREVGRRLPPLSIDRWFVGLVKPLDQFVPFFKHTVVIEHFPAEQPQQARPVSRLKP